MTSTTASTSAIGTRYASDQPDADFNIARSRLRCRTAGVTASAVSCTLSACRCRARASGATITRAPAMRARQQRSRSSAPGNVFSSKPPSSPKRSDADEHHGARDEEDVADGVVLLLVELARLDAGVRGAEPVDRLTDLEQDLRVVVVDELRPDDRRVGPERLLDQQADRGGVDDDVVVAEQDEGRALHHLDHVVGRRREARGLREPADERAGQDARDAGGGIDRGSGVQDQDREGRVVGRCRAPPGPPRATARGPS